MASLTDLVTDTRNAARPNSAKVSSPRSPSGPTLVCDNLSGWPTASKVHFVTYQIDSSSNPVAGTQLDAVGIVSGNSITSFTVKDGTDSGNAVNDVVEMLPTAAWGQDLATALVTEHDRTGKHTNITASSITNSGNSTIGGNQTVTGTLGVTGATTLTGAVGGTGYSLATISNPYKFSASQNSGQTGISAATKLTFTNKIFDTGTNYSTVTSLFTAPIAGFYMFMAFVHTSPTGADTSAFINIYKNGVDNGSIAYSAGSNLNRGLSGSQILSLAANDTIGIYLSSTAGNVASVASGTDVPTFSGFLVSAT